MRLLILLTIVWNLPVYTWTKDVQNHLRAGHKNSNSLQITNGALSNDGVKRVGELVPEKRLSDFRDRFPYKLPFGNTRFGKHMKLTLNADVRTDAKHYLNNGLSVISKDNYYTKSRLKRSADANRREALREMIFDLHETLKDPENYRNLLTIIGELQDELEQNPLPSGPHKLIQNLLNTIMKRRFNSWGGKRESQVRAMLARNGLKHDPQIRSNFYAWGGRKKKESGPVSERLPRRFSAWGGKRSVYLPPNNNALFKTSVESEIPSLDVTGSSLPYPAGEVDRQLENNFLLPDNEPREMNMGLQPGFLAVLPEQHSPNYYDLPKRSSFSAWGGKRSGFDPSSIATDTAFTTLPKSNDEWDRIRYLTDNQ